MAELLSTRDLDPARRERDREDHDERGAMIRAMARARAGDVLLFENEWSIRLACENNPGLELAETANRL